MNIIDILKSESYKAFNLCDQYLRENNRDWALVQYGRACGLLQALDKLVGSYAITDSLVSLKRRLEDDLGY